MKSDAFNGQGDALVSWIEPDVEEQIRWISSYLYKKGRSDLLNEHPAYPADGERLLAAIRNVVANDNLSRDLIRSMRGAWHQRKYRERSGKQVSFQLPEDVIRGLDKISKDGGKSRTQAIRQIIRNANKRNKYEKSRSRGKVLKLENNLKKLKEKKLDAEAVRNGIISILSKRMVQEVMARCDCEAVCGASKSEQAEVHRSSQYWELVKERIDEIDKLVWEIGVLGSGVEPLVNLIPQPQSEIDK
jgi:metal-responsive CopG/Arc/MetJ family transcriptional regulator